MVPGRYGEHVDWSGLCFDESARDGVLRGLRCARRNGTHPTLLHNPNAPEIHSEPIGLTATQRAALLKGMEEVTTIGTAASVFSKTAMKIPGVRIAGKTGTAQIPGKKDVAWFICFAPLENPEVAIAVSCEGDTAGEDYAGATYAAPVADTILKRYFDRKAHPMQLKVDATPAVTMQ